MDLDSRTPDSQVRDRWALHVERMGGEEPDREAMDRGALYRHAQRRRGDQRIERVVVVRLTSPCQLLDPRHDAVDFFFGGVEVGA
jgi:hypothetical protein